MILFPAIDLSDGKVVRLKRGKMEEKTVFNNNPLKQAMIFELKGAKWIHVVDLDGAFSGKSENSDEIKRIVKKTKVKIQLGGGVRDLNAISYWLELGVSRLVLGTAAIRNPSFAEEASRKFPGKIAISLDINNNKILTDGWKVEEQYSISYYLKKFSSIRLSAIIFTDITRDGVMKGPNINQIKNLSKETNIPLIASGGVSSLKDLEKIDKTGISGVIVGRAIYQEIFDLKDALLKYSEA